MWLQPRKFIVQDIWVSMKRDGYQCAKQGPELSLLQLEERQRGHLTFRRKVLNHLLWGETVEVLKFHLPCLMVPYTDPTPDQKHSLVLGSSLVTPTKCPPWDGHFGCIISEIQLETKVLTTKTWKGIIFTNH